MKVTAQQYAAMSGVSVSTARKRLDRLVEAGLARRVFGNRINGAARSSLVWRGPPVVKIIEYDLLTEAAQSMT